MSDLQCPVRVLLVAREGHRFGPLGDTLRPQRLARIYGGPEASARHTAARLSDDLGVPAVVLAGLAGPPGPADQVTADRESTDAQPALRRLMDGLADEHRGEAVLIVGDERVLAALAPRRAGIGAPAAGADPLPPDVVIAVEGDADGWRLVRPWPITA